MRKKLLFKATHGPMRHHVFAIATPNHFVIGRGKNCALALPSDKFASRYHASISFEGNTIYIKDRESTNGTFVNDRRISTAHKIKPGDNIKTGNTVLLLVAAT